MPVPVQPGGHLQGGGVSLPEVRRIVGDQICLIGNVNCGLLQTGTDDTVFGVWASVYGTPPISSGNRSRSAAISLG